MPKTQTTCWLNVASPSVAVDLLNRAKTEFDAQLTAFELVSETALSLVLKNIPGAQRPTAPGPWYVLAEFSDVVPEAVERWLAAQLANGLVADGTLAASQAQATKLWAQFDKQFRKQLADAASSRTLDLLAALSQTAAFSIGCYCDEERRCHRSILRSLLKERGALIAE